MIKIDYAMQADLVDQYIKVKDDMIEARAKMPTEEVEKAKVEIIDGAVINQIDAETGLAEYRVENRVAYIPVTGMLSEEVHVCAAFFGESITTYGYIREAAQEADDNPLVDKIAFEMNSGGGAVSGVDLTSDAIKGLSKPTIALVGELAASACYWLSSACDEIVATSKTGFVGSIGVVTELIDRRGRDKEDGIDRYVVTNSDSKGKRPDISKKEGMQIVVDRLDATYTVFVDSILDKRNDLSREKIKELDGRLLIASDAIEYGLVDGFVNKADLQNYFNGNNSVVDGKNKIEEGKMDKKEIMSFEDYLKSNPEAEARHKSLVNEAVANAKTEEGNRVNRILTLAHVNLTEETKAAIENGQTPGEYAEAVLENHAENVGADNSKKISIPKAKGAGKEAENAKDDPNSQGLKFWDTVYENKEDK